MNAGKSGMKKTSLCICPSPHISSKIKTPIQKYKATSNPFHGDKVWAES
jgi:hypothetical protein